MPSTRYSEWIFHNPHTRDDELSWLEQQGPWCPALIDYLGTHSRSYDAVIFFTYLYAPTVLGLEVAAERSILAPTAHDEPAIHLDIYKEMFQRPRAIAYNTEVEKVFLKTDVRHPGGRRGNGWMRRRSSRRRCDLAASRSKRLASRTISALRRPDRSRQRVRPAARIFCGLQRRRMDRPRSCSWARS